MGAIGNYEVVQQAYSLPLWETSWATVTVPVPAGKVALGWGAEKDGNDDLIVTGFPALDGTSVTFQFSQKEPGPGTSTGTLYVACAEMGC